MEARPLRRKSLPIAERRKQHRIVQRIRVDPARPRRGDLWSQSKRLVVAAALDPVHAAAKVKRVIPRGLAGVVTAFQVLLEYFLRSKPAWPELSSPTGQIAECEVHGKRCPQGIRSTRRALQGILIAQIPEAESVNVITVFEVEPAGVRRRVAGILVDGIVVAKVVHRLVQVVTEPVKGMRRLGKVPVQLPGC